MKRGTKTTAIIVLSAAACFCGSGAYAQEPVKHVMVDSVIYISVSSVNEALEGRDIFEIMPSESDGDGTEVVINQSGLISDSMRSHIQSNDERTLGGYRVRIFFDNKQSARNESEATLKKFKKLFPDIKAYRIYANPYFKVTVGDFRTKSEAMALLSRIKGPFPSAFVVRENIEYPVADSKNAVIRDTIQVMKPIIQ